MKRRGRTAGSRAAKWIVAGTLLAAGLHYFRDTWRGAREAEFPPNAFFEVKRADLLISVVEEGSLRALNETVVRSELDGLNRVIHVVPEGSRVEKGDLLVELDSAGLKDRLNEQELAHQERLFQKLQAAENLKIAQSLAESQVKDAELKIENAESDLEKYRDGDAPLLIKTVVARIGVLAEQVRIAGERSARTQELFKSGNATKSELEADALSLKREQLALEQYQEDLRLIQKYDQPNQVRLLESKVAQAREELVRLKQRASNEVAQAEADVKTSDRNVALLEESLRTQKRRLANTKILAPQAGLVVYAPISQFQSWGGGGSGGSSDGRSRGSRGGSGGGDGEFRGGGRRGGRSGSEGGSGGSASSSTAQAVATANQRIASAISGTSAAQPGTAGGAQGAGRMSGGGLGASGGSGFATYSSLRPSSTIASSKAEGGGSGAGSGSGVSVSSGGGMSSGQGASIGGGTQSAYRSSSQSFGGYEYYGTPGVLEAGTMVRQRQELIRLPDVSKMLAEIKIHESRVRQVAAGMTVHILVENIPDRRFKGTVRKVALLPDAQESWLNPDLKVYPADVLIDEELPALKPGVSARAEIIITNLVNVLSVPIHTVARLRGEHVCFVKRGKGVVPIPVTTGMYNDRFVEITSGLQENDLVLLAAVGDEAVEEAPTRATNEVGSATEEAPAPAREPVEGNPAEGRMQRREGAGENGGAAPAERRRPRGPRPQATPEAGE